MSTEITFNDEADAQEAPPIAPPVPAETKKPKKDDKKAEAAGDEKEKVSTRRISPELQAVQQAEDRSIREILEHLGTQGAYSIRLLRKDPNQAYDSATGKMIQISGYLESVDQPIDEDWIRQKYGGGRYMLEFKKRNEKGQLGFFTKRVVEISGDPILTNVPRAPNMAPQANGTSPLADKVVDLMQRNQDRLEKQLESKPRGDDGIVALLRDQLNMSNRVIEELRKEMRELANMPRKEEDPVKDKLLEKLMDNDTARLQAVRMQYESEIRSLKDNAIAEEKRIRDVHEREKQEIRNSHERELALVRQSHDTSLVSSRSSHEVSMASAKASFDTQMKLLESENRRLERDNAELRIDIKDLRAKKEKTIFESAKELEAIKDLVGGDEPKGGWDKVAEVVSNPDTIAAVGSFFKGAPAAPPPPLPVAMGPRIAKDAAGNKYMAYPDGRLERLPPKRIARKVEAAPGEEAPPPEPQLPEIEAEQLATITKYLEGAFDGGQEPEMVAQSVRSLVPEEMLAAIRDHGVDVVLTKVAKLQSTSPLMSQLGRKWARKLGKELVGE